MTNKTDRLRYLLAYKVKGECQAFSLKTDPELCVGYLSPAQCEGTGAQARCLTMGNTFLEESMLEDKTGVSLKTLEFVNVFILHASGCSKLSKGKMHSLQQPSA